VHWKYINSGAVTTFFSYSIKWHCYYRSLKHSEPVNISDNSDIGFRKISECMLTTDYPFCLKGLETKKSGANPATAFFLKKWFD